MGFRQSRSAHPNSKIFCAVARTTFYSVIWVYNSYLKITLMSLISSNRFHLLSPHHMCQAEPVISSLHILVENPDPTAWTETSSCSASPFLQLMLQPHKAACSSFIQDFLLEHIFFLPVLYWSTCTHLSKSESEAFPFLATYFFKAPKIPYGLFTCLLDYEFL